MVVKASFVPDMERSRHRRLFQGIIGTFTVPELGSTDLIHLDSAKSYLARLPQALLILSFSHLELGHPAMHVDGKILFTMNMGSSTGKQ